MKLIGQLDSPFVRRVAVLMNCYQIDFEREIISVFTDFDDMLKINPLAKVPVLKLDNGESLFDSRVIMDYLDTLVTPDQCLMPLDHPRRFEMLRIESIALGLAEKCYERGVEFSRKNPDTIDTVWTDRLKQQLQSVLGWLEALNPDPWLCGDSMSRPDITCAAAFTFLKEKQQIPWRPGDYPALEKHCEYCESLPVFSRSAYSVSEAQRSGWVLNENT